MGIIYKATSPSGRSYIGQTKYTAEKRWRQHINEANRKKFHQCRALNEAIRKHGGHNFKLEVILECSDDEMNDWEEEYIWSEKTLYPDGYNLTKGGYNTTVEYTEEIRQRISDAHRKFSHDDYELPRYVRYIKEKVGNREVEGFRINIPNKKRYLFTDSTLTLDRKYELTMEMHQKILDGTDDPTKNNKKKYKESEDLPIYIHYNSLKESYLVKKPGTTEKRFNSKDDTKEERLQKALDYLNSL